MSAFNDALDSAKIQLISINGSPFLAGILLALKIEEDSNDPTAYVDGIRMGINPDYFLTQSKKNQLGLLMHECWHVALDHITRFDPNTMDLNLWNRACDYVINTTLVDNGIPINEIGLFKEKYRGMTEWEIYQDLLKNKDQHQDNNDKYAHFGKPKDDNGNEYSDAATAAKIRQIVMESAIRAKALGEDLKKTAGGMYGTLEVFLDSIVNPKIDYRTLLMNYLSDFAKNDYSYKRLNKRYLQYDLIAPTLYSESLGALNIYIDTSGSVSDKAAANILGQVSLIQQLMNPSKINLVTFDTRIQSETDVTTMDLSTFKIVGRGGTSLDCVFEHCEENQPELVIIMSDFDCPLSYGTPSYPVICIGVDTRKDIQTPFGYYIEYS